MNKFRIKIVVCAVLVFNSCTSSLVNAANGVEAPASLTLNGRLEQITGQGAQLPINRTIRGLKSGAAKLDASVINQERPKLSTGVDAFPKDWSGNWGGRFVVSWSRFDPRVPPSGRQLQSGDKGLAILSFGADKANRTMLEPAKIFFVPSQGQSVKDAQVPLFQAQQAASILRNHPDAKAEVALLELGVVETVDVNKQLVQREVLKNTLYRLAPNVIEQNIVTRLNRFNGTAGTTSSSYVETVVRLTTYKPGLLWTQIGYVQYNDEHQPMGQYLVQGWITRNWQAAGRGIEEMTGATLGQLGYDGLVVPAEPAIEASAKAAAKGRPANSTRK